LLQSTRRLFAKGALLLLGKTFGPQSKTPGGIRHTGVSD